VTHTHPCAHCTVPVVCHGTLKENHDGHPPVICTSYHLPAGKIEPLYCERCAPVIDLLLDLAEYFDDRMDINDDGGPNAAMTWHGRIMEVLR
jgi:hypothetical protein